MCEDNKGANDSVKKALNSSNSKHMDVRHRFICEMATSGDILVQLCLSEDQHEDDKSYC